MRILMCAGFYDVSGFSTVMEQLANKLVEKGHNVTIGALWFRLFPSKGLYSVSSIPVGNIVKLRRFLDKFDIIHSHHAITNYLALVSRKPFVYHYHGAPIFGRDYLYRLSMISSIKLTKHLFDAVISVSNSGVAELERYFNLDNVHLVYNGVDTCLFKHGLEEKFRKGTPQFLFVGNLYAHKKVEHIILAMEKLLKIYPEAYLQIVGNGRMYEYLHSFIAKLGLESHVQLVGRVSGNELPYRYASCDVYVTASQYEVCPVPLMEAMACGKTIVVSSISPHVELINKSKAGVTYAQGNINNLCKLMIETYEQCNLYKSNALQFAKAHDWSVIADVIINIYDSVLRERN